MVIQLFCSLIDCPMIPNTFPTHSPSSLAGGWITGWTPALATTHIHSSLPGGWIAGWTPALATPHIPSSLPGGWISGWTPALATTHIPSSLPGGWITGWTPAHLQVLFPTHWHQGEGHWTVLRGTVAKVGESKFRWLIILNKASCCHTN